MTMQDGCRVDSDSLIDKFDDQSVRAFDVKAGLPIPIGAFELYIVRAQIIVGRFDIRYQQIERELGNVAIRCVAACLPRDRKEQIIPVAVAQAKGAVFLFHKAEFQNVAIKAQRIEPCYTNTKPLTLKASKGLRFSSLSASRPINPITEVH